MRRRPHGLLTRRQNLSRRQSALPPKVMREFCLLPVGPNTLQPPPGAGACQPPDGFPRGDTKYETPLLARPPQGHLIARQASPLFYGAIPTGLHAGANRHTRRSLPAVRGVLQDYFPLPMAGRRQPLPGLLLQNQAAGLRSFPHQRARHYGRGHKFRSTMRLFLRPGEQPVAMGDRKKKAQNKRT